MPQICARIRGGVYCSPSGRAPLPGGLSVALSRVGGFALAIALVSVLLLSLLFMGQAVARDGASSSELAQKLGRGSSLRTTTEALAPYENDADSAWDDRGTTSGDLAQGSEFLLSGGDDYANLSSVWGVLARLEAWEQCRGDYTPPKWCQALPLRLDVRGSFSAKRQRELQAERRAFRVSADRASQFQAFVESTRNVIGPRVAQGDITVIIERANSGDPDAMELMGWLHIQEMIPNNLVSLSNEEHAYIWYARAYLAGAERVKKDMDTVWSQMPPEQQRRMVQYFDTEEDVKKG